jgi:hypothetical protein
MTDAIQVSINDPLIRRILKATYPAYRGRKIRIVPQRYPLNCKSYWEGGSRDYFAFVRLDTFAVASMPAQSAFDKDIRGAESVTLPSGVICVEHSIFCGKDVGIRIHVNPENLVSMLPASHPALLPPPELSFDDERQAWVKDGKYVRCGHPESLDCGCYGRLHEGEQAVTHGGH